MKLLKIRVLGLDVAHRPSGGPHDNGVRGDVMTAEADALQEVAVGYTRCGKKHVRPGHFFKRVLLLDVLDAHAMRTLDLLVARDHKTRLHLATDTTKRGSCKHTFRGTADTCVDIDAGFVRIGRVNNARDVTITDQADCSTGRPDFFNQAGVARTVSCSGLGRRLENLR